MTLAIAARGAQDPQRTRLEGPGESLGALVEAFLLNRRVANYSARTVALYAANLHRFAAATSDARMPSVSHLKRVVFQWVCKMPRH